jgi:hypothetical protein
MVVSSVVVYTHVGGNFFIFVILAVLGIEKQIKIKEPSVSSIPKNLKESPNFMKEPIIFQLVILEP